MSSVIENLIVQLLASTNAGQAKPLVDALVSELCRITHVDLHPAFFHDEFATLTPRGKAVSLVTAAQCAEDVERTRVFIQGIYAAIRSKLDAQLDKQQSLRILYAGTGPFGLLVVPLLPLFLNDRIKVSLLDIHAESLVKVKTLIDYLGVDQLMEHVVQADACQWQSPEQFDLIISETMRQGLIQEPQVSVFAHLQQFLVDEGLLIPEIIRLDLWLARAGVVREGIAPVHLGKLFQLDRATSQSLGNGDQSCLQGILNVPEYAPALSDLKLTTFIQVFEEHQLFENQSQLTLPIYEKNARPVPGSELTYYYRMGEYPRCEFYYAQLPDNKSISLPDTCEANTQGVYHLRRLWQKVQHQKAATTVMRTQVAELAEREWLLDRVLIDSLGLGLEPTLEQLYRSNHLEEFEDWITTANKEAFTKETIAKTNHNILKFLQVKNDTAPSLNAPLSAEQLAFWDVQGYLVVSGVLTSAESANARKAIWEFLGMDETKPETWYRNSVEMKKIMVQMFDHPTLDIARNSEYLRCIFQQLWQRDDLIMITDRVSFNPPETQTWRFPGPAIHWDVDLKPPVPFATQALIYLTDVAENQGAFCCVPGFHKKIDQWLRDMPEGVDSAEQDWSQWPIKPIAAKAGDLIIWHQALPHGSSPNRAHYPRMVQYINMYC